MNIHIHTYIYVYNLLLSLTALRHFQLFFFCSYYRAASSLRMRVGVREVNPNLESKLLRRTGGHLQHTPFPNSTPFVQLFLLFLFIGRRALC